MRSATSTVLVTGGLGYIGSYVVPDLLERGWRVRILDNGYRVDPVVAARVAGLPGVEVADGDVRYPASIASVMPGVEAVVHLAGVCLNKSIRDPVESLDVNLLGTQHVIDSAARHGVRRIVYASSASIYGNPATLPMREDDTPAPITPYCIAKLGGEHLLRFHAERSNISWLALRLFNVYGPGQKTDHYYTSVILTFLQRLAAGREPLIDGRGEQSMDFVYVTDVARAFGLAVESDASGLSLNVGTGCETTIAELARLLAKLLDLDVQPVFRPREVLVMQRRASLDRVHQVLGWAPGVELTDGLSAVIEHSRSAGLLGG
jgi:UDP-glucose 4-epimerase